MRLLRFACFGLLAAVALLAVLVLQMRSMQTDIRNVVQSQRAVAQRIEKLKPIKEGVMVMSLTWTSGGVTAEWVHVEQGDNNTDESVPAFLARADAIRAQALLDHKPDGS